MSGSLISLEITDFLDSEEAIAEYYSQVQANGDPDELQRALGYVAKARSAIRTAREQPPVTTKPIE